MRSLVIFDSQVDLFEVIWTLYDSTSRGCAAPVDFQSTVEIGWPVGEIVRGADDVSDSEDWASGVLYGAESLVEKAPAVVALIAHSSGAGVVHFYPV